MSELDRLGAFYENVKDAQTIARIQTERFNAHWSRAWREVPFYTRWRNEHRLPEQIGHIRDLGAFPVLTKAELSASRDLLDRTPGIERHTLTGGTSGIATAFPMNGDDARVSWADTYLGRRWNGIEPGDRLFMIWGHSHLFSGRGAWRKQFKRNLKDWAANIDRVSAYNLGTPELDLIAAHIAADCPVYLIGYGSCLAQLCRHLCDCGRNLRAAGVRRVVNTSETMPTGDAQLVQEIFGCPVINEYGMAEAGVIGYSRDALYPVSVFWHDFVVRISDRRIILTTLGDRCFPLINYDTEDLSNDPMSDLGSVSELHSLAGKARDVFAIVDANGVSHDVSVVLFDHVLKQIPQLHSFHYTLCADGRVRIDYTAQGGPLEDALLQARFAAGLYQEGIRIHPDMAEFCQINAPLQTLAGKRLTLSKDLA